jgi:uncharacterized protein YdhG (YjbR/CyaY superfamily)
MLACAVDVSRFDPWILGLQQMKSTTKKSAKSTTKKMAGAGASSSKSPAASKAKPASAGNKTFDDYLNALPNDQKEALEKMRQVIKGIVPEAEEGISYGLAAFRLNGKPLVALGGADQHCAFYPMSSSTVAAFQTELKGFQTSTGTIRFQASNPIPDPLLQKLVMARIAENEARSPAGQKKKSVPAKTSADSPAKKTGVKKAKVTMPIGKPTAAKKQLDSKAKKKPSPAKKATGVKGASKKAAVKKSRK